MKREKRITVRFTQEEYKKLLELADDNEIAATIRRKLFGGK